LRIELVGGLGIAVVMPGQRRVDQAGDDRIPIPRAAPVTIAALPRSRPDFPSAVVAMMKSPIRALHDQNQLLASVVPNCTKFR
jgi:hypothetical protein